MQPTPAQPTLNDRLSLLTKAIDAATAANDELDQLSNSPNPNVAAAAMGFLVVSRDEAADLTAIKALQAQPAQPLKQLSQGDLDNLSALETAIDQRIKNNALINGALDTATAVLRAAEGIGEVLK